MTKTDCTLLHLEDSLSLDAHSFACENRTPYPLEVTLDLSRSGGHFHVSTGHPLIKRVIPPSSFSMIASIKRRKGEGRTPIKLDIDFKCKKVLPKL